jgi:hypothetical protein
MSADSTNPAFAQDLQAQHHELRDFLHEGTQLLANTGWTVDDLFSLLAVLRRHLQEHFEHEERGGYFREAIVARPQLAPRANTLLEQHGSFMAMIDELMALVGTDMVSAASRREIESRWQRFSSEFCQHEAGEVDLLQFVFNEDLGSVD